MKWRKRISIAMAIVLLYGLSMGPAERITNFSVELTPDQWNASQKAFSLAYLPVILATSLLAQPLYNMWGHYLDSLKSRQQISN